MAVRGARGSAQGRDALNLALLRAHTAKGPVDSTVLILETFAFDLVTKLAAQAAVP